MAKQGRPKELKKFISSNNDDFSYIGYYKQKDGDKVVILHDYDGNEVEVRIDNYYETPRDVNYNKGFLGVVKQCLEKNTLVGVRQAINKNLFEFTLLEETITIEGIGGQTVILSNTDETRKYLKWAVEFINSVD